MMDHIPNYQMSIDPDSSFQQVQDQCLASATMLTGGKICGIMGIVPVWPGVAEVWFMPTTHTKAHTRQVVKLMRVFIQNSFPAFNLHRIQASAIATNKQHCKFLRLLGFKDEGLMEKFDPLGLDHRRYSYIWPK